MCWNEYHVLFKSSRPSTKWQGDSRSLDFVLVVSSESVTIMQCKNIASTLWTPTTFWNIVICISVNGRAIAEAVSRWLPTAAARVRARVWQVGRHKVASGQVLSEYFGFPCQNRSFHQLHHHHNYPGQLTDALQRADHPSKESCWLLDLVTEMKRKVPWRRPRPKMGCRATGKKKISDCRHGLDW
jgi:hypothetical protein